MPIGRPLFSCFFPHHVVTIHRFPPSNQDFRREKRFSDWRNGNEWNAAVGDQSAEERSGTSLRSPLCSRGISVAAKESFHSTLFPAPLSLSVSLFISCFVSLVVYSFFPSASEDHLPQFQSCHRGEPFFAGRQS